EIAGVDDAVAIAVGARARHDDGVSERPLPRQEIGAIDSAVKVEVARRPDGCQLNDAFQRLAIAEQKLELKAIEIDRSAAHIEQRSQIQDCSPLGKLDLAARVELSYAKRVAVVGLV